MSAQNLQYYIRTVLHDSQDLEWETHVIRPLLGDTADLALSVHDHHPIRPRNHVQVVRDHHPSPRGERALEDTLVQDLMRDIGIHRRERVVQEDDGAGGIVGGAG